MSQPGEWTWLVYMAGDNNLEGAGHDDLAEMQRVGSTDQVNVIVQFDTEEKKTTRYRVEKGKLKTLQELAGVDCGDPRVLSGFIQWGIKNFPARRYLLDVWNHGGGWENLPADYDYDSIRAAKPAAGAKLKRVKRAIFRSTVYKIDKRPPRQRAIAIDCGAHDYLDNQELRSAVMKALPNGRKLDVLGCDACLMNMLEIAYEMKDTAQVMVGSEETEPGAGWPYAAILKALTAKPAMDAAQLGQLIVTEYGKYFKRTSETATQSAFNLDKIGALASAVDEMADALRRDLKKVAGTVTLARDRAQKFEMPEYIDLGDFALQLSRRLPKNAPAQAGLKKIAAALDSRKADGFVLQNVTCSDKAARARGVAIYFPHPEAYAPDYGDLMYSNKGKWRSFLQALFKA